MFFRIVWIWVLVFWRVRCWNFGGFEEEVLVSWVYFEFFIWVIVFMDLSF